MTKTGSEESKLVKELVNYKSSPPEVFLRKGVLKICSKFTREHPCRSAISIKLLCNFIEITIQHGCSPANLLHIFRKPFLKTPLDGYFYIDVLRYLAKFTAKFMRTAASGISDNRPCLAGCKYFDVLQN